MIGMRATLVVAVVILVAAADHADALEVGSLRLEGRCVGAELNGEIRHGEAVQALKRIEATATQCGTRTVIIGKMPGGSASDAIAIGEALRAREYVTAVLPNSDCYSACGLVYLGGVHRYWREGARFLIHRPQILTTFKSVAEETEAYEQLRDRLIRYVANMGASPDYVDAMYAFGPRDHAILSLQQLNAWALFMTDGAPF